MEKHQFKKNQRVRHGSIELIIIDFLPYRKVLCKSAGITREFSIDKLTAI